MIRDAGGESYKVYMLTIVVPRRDAYCVLREGL